MVTEVSRVISQSTVDQSPNAPGLAAELLLVSLGIEVLVRMGLSKGGRSGQKATHRNVHKPIAGAGHGVS